MLILLKRRAVRDFHRPFRWIDTICINQDDIPERNAQVSIMSTIYMKADEVIAWLGEEDGDSLLLFGTIFEHKKSF